MFGILSSHFLVLLLLMNSVTGLDYHKRILVSDQTYVHGLEVKIQELTAKVDGNSMENQNLKQTVQELTANITKLQSQTEKPTAPRSCPDGYIKMSHSCYRIHHNEMTWTEAVTFCKTFGAHLAIENTPAEHIDLKQKVTELQGACYWIGASDANFEGHWEWIDSTQTVSNISWYPGEPNQGVTADCACLYKGANYGVVDENCGSKYNFICEIE